MNHSPHFHPRRRPPWWPENEPWPPTRPWHMRRNPFFRRLGCFFAGFAFLGMVGFISIVTLIADALGLVQTPLGDVGPRFPIGIGIILVILMALAWGARSLRRMSAPLDDLLEASKRVAEDDYSVRVEERGPAEVRSLGAAFNSMVARLQVNDQQRRAMLADLTHELRTPLTVMRGNLEGILDGLYPVSEARLKSILDETHMLSRLVDDLRTLALAESGALQLRREPVDLAALVRETVTAFEAQADAAGVKIMMQLETNAVLELDPQRMREVLSNLLTNALRYNPRGEPILIRLTESAPGAGRGVQLSVEDCGPGISSEDLPHVFDRFSRSSDSVGMGLGLSISKYIVQAHGGEITAESAAGRGTRISFTLPH